MTDKKSDGTQVKTDKKTKKNLKDSEIPMPKTIDLKAAHRKAMLVMIGIFLAILLVMVVFQDQMDFATTGGM
ncbi:MAG: hypothetical protein EOM80_08655 [Erysipelotrichia bacterium]|nr:hypothetical protein [Erysipelotrichia bacterium]